MAKKKTKKKDNVFVAKFKSVSSKVKAKTKKYKDDLSSGYNVGYNSGWKDHDKLPNCKGKITIATNGYHNGLKDKSRYNKIQNRVSNKVR